MNLPNFYNEFSNGRKDFEALYRVYDALGSYLSEYITQVANDAIITKVETFRKIPLQRINVNSIRYSLTTLLNEPLVLNSLSLGGFSLEDRISQWETGVITLAQKVSALDLSGRYISLYSNRGILGEQNTVVIDFKLTNDQEAFYYSRGLDYVFQNNKLYLLGSIATPSSDHYLVLKNIYVDLLIPDQLLGSRLGLLYNEAVTRNEYTELLSALMKASLKGPIIKELQDEIRKINEFKDTKFYDMYSTEAVENGIWSFNTNMTPFDFVASFPTSYLQEEQKLQMLIQYLNIVKPAFSRLNIVLVSDPEIEIYDAKTNVVETISPDVMEFFFYDVFGSETNGTELTNDSFDIASVELISEDLYNINSIDDTSSSALIRVSDNQTTNYAF